MARKPSVSSSSPAKDSSPKSSNKGKGKAVVPSSPSTTSSTNAVPPTQATSVKKLTSAQQQLKEEDDDPLLGLADAVTTRAHLLIPGKTDEALVERANQVVKASFDHALLSESTAFANLQSLLQSISSSSAGPSTRSRTSAYPSSSSAHDHDDVPQKLDPTPLLELTTEGMDPEMVWEQMEMRNGVVVELLESMFGGEGEGSDQEDGEEGETGSDEEEEGLEGSDDEEMGEFDDEEEGSDDESSDEEDEDEEEGGDGEGYGEGEEYYRKLGLAPHEVASDDEDPMADETKDLSIATFDKPGSGRAQRRAPGPASAVDDQFFSLHDFHVQTDEGEYEMDRALRGEADDDDEEEEDDGIDLFASIPGSGLDDDEEEDEEEEEEVDEEDENLDGGGIMYKDFFQPPPRPLSNGKNRKGKALKDADVPKPSSKGAKGKSKADPTSAAAAAPSEDEEKEPTTKKEKKRGVRFSDAVKVKTIAARQSRFDKLVAKFGWEKAAEMMDRLEQKGANEGIEKDDDEEEAEEEGSEEEEEEDEDVEIDEENSFGAEEDEEDDQDDEGDDDEEDEDEGQETIERLKTSLFDDEEEEEEEGLSESAKLSRHERKLLALSSQIAALEAENVGPKDWATKGEAKANDRPVNSLLEEDLEYERAGKVVPVITEETTKTIEDLIKRRILDNQFDDVVRRRPVDPNAFLPSRYMEIQDTKSNKSLAEIYEEDYAAAKEKEAGREVVNELDKDLEKKHLEIEELFEELSGKLDALSNARFTPKPPKATITTISNIPSVSLESALPTSASTATLLAPEEVFVPDPTKEDRSDFTPAQKKAARQKRRKARASMAQAAEKFSKGSKGDKERATKQLLGTRGVTVLGKGAAAKDSKSLKRKRTADDDGGRSGVSLKL